MTERQYPIHLRRIGEPEIADYLEGLMTEIDTHEKMFLELCKVKRERDALLETMRRGGLARVVCCGNCEHCVVIQSDDAARLYCTTQNRFVGVEMFCSEGVPREVNADGLQVVSAQGNR